MFLWLATWKRELNNRKHFQESLWNHLNKVQHFVWSLPVWSQTEVCRMSIWPFYLDVNLSTDAVTQEKVTLLHCRFKFKFSTALRISKRKDWLQNIGSGRKIPKMPEDIGDIHIVLISLWWACQRRGCPMLKRHKHLEGAQQMMYLTFTSGCIYRHYRRFIAKHLQISDSFCEFVSVLKENPRDL